MHNMTPIRVRGKRNAAPPEKWHAGKKRQLFNQITSTVSPQPGSNAVYRSSTAVPQKRKQTKSEQSRIEQLPVEIVQDIFVKSSNTNLPLTCKSLMGQLSSRHLYMMLTSSVMEPFKSGNAKPQDVQILAARRLLNCNFMTWDFWTAWLDDKFQSAEPHESKNHTETAITAAHYVSLTARELSQLPGLPPTKLLSGPWTPDKLNFLRATSRPGFDLVNQSSTDCELAQEGLQQAVAEGSLEAANLMFRNLGLRPTTDLLCKAVTEYGCNKAVVELLLDQGGQELDLLEPALWSWAETSDRRGDDKGIWLIKQLKQRTQADHESDYT
ncbi:hypothetical protein Tdes44962_MAKER00020 [Teratosphaeria destructans]|uniref:Uncharacterized protein n=1 Tax=Teratosphaeria destructans TaxID=418781 RepID=A0A9W7W8A9_9PEZI|nr:hypothetical protein Tdes44962_MAKER00020 [Teratosphaeria destructans]